MESHLHQLPKVFLVLLPACTNLPHQLNLPWEFPDSCWRYHLVSTVTGTYPGSWCWICSQKCYLRECHFWCYSGVGVYDMVLAASWAWSVWACWVGSQQRQGQGLCPNSIPALDSWVPRQACWAPEPLRCPSTAAPPKADCYPQCELPAAPGAQAEHQFLPFFFPGSGLNQNRSLLPRCCSTVSCF